MPSSAFQKAFAHTIGIEGKYSDNPADSGGKTMFGITEALARQCGYRGEMSKMTIDIAQSIYFSQFWEKMQLTEVASMNEALALELFDTGVNCGVPTSVMFLQRCLSAFNNKGTLYPDVFEDGVIGRSTLKALHSYAAKRGFNGVQVLIRSLNCLQGARYIDLSQKRQKDEEFVFGWMLNRVALS